MEDRKQIEARVWKVLNFQAFLDNHPDVHLSEITYDLLCILDELTQERVKIFAENLPDALEKSKYQERPFTAEERTAITREHIEEFK